MDKESLILIALFLISFLLFSINLFLYRISLRLSRTNWARFYEDKVRKEKEKMEEKERREKDLEEERKAEKWYGLGLVDRMARRVRCVPGFSLEHPTLVDELENAKN